MTSTKCDQCGHDQYSRTEGEYDEGLSNQRRNLRDEMKVDIGQYITEQFSKIDDSIILAKMYGDKEREQSWVGEKVGMLEMRNFVESLLEDWN